MPPRKNGSRTRSRSTGKNAGSTGKNGRAGKGIPKAFLKDDYDPRAAASLPDGGAGQLVIPAGTDPVLADLIGQVNRPDHRAWLAQVARIGGCAHPLHLRGFTRVSDRASGVVDFEFSSRAAPGGVVLARCGNRRAAVCPSCAWIYQGDVYHLVRSGLEGGKGVPQSVAAHPRVFATLTAPSFGPVHSIHAPDLTGRATRPCHPRRTPTCEHNRAAACFARHGEDDAQVGAPLCPDCYDYQSAVIWQSSVGKLWWRFCKEVRRHLGRLGGLSNVQAENRLQLSYVKVVEYQRRGLVHVHAVLRVDGTPPDDSGHAPEAGAQQASTITTPPVWATAALLEQAVRKAAAAVLVRVEGGSGSSWAFGWGQELDVKDLTASPDSPDAAGHGVAGHGGGADGSAAEVAAYVAKYTSKSTEVTGWNPRDPEGTPRAAHALRMARTAWALGERPELAALKLGRWGKELAYRGHVSSKSRHYSTTLTRLRQARAEHRVRAAIERGERTLLPLIEQGTDTETHRGTAAGPVVESSWELVGFGYTRGQALLADEIARDQAVNRAAAREAGAARTREGGRGPREANGQRD